MFTIALEKRGLGLVNILYSYYPTRFNPLQKDFHVFHKGIFVADRCCILSKYYYLLLIIILCYSFVIFYIPSPFGMSF